MNSYFKIYRQIAAISLTSVRSKSGLIVLILVMETDRQTAHFFVQECPYACAAPAAEKTASTIATERALARRRGRRTGAAGRLFARRRASDRREDRLRWRRVRRLHGPGRRRSRAVLHHARGALRGPRRRNDRGPGDARAAQPIAARLSREARHAMRLLHAGNDHGGRSAAAAQSEAERRGHPQRHCPAISAVAPVT